MYSYWNRFSPYFSADYSREYLKRCYQRLQIEQSEQKSFENCYSFMYYLEHGKIYYEQAAVSPIQIKPILLFYGLVQLIKACILTVNPNYPETTSVLAHGLSTRKRKKQQYSFFEDEVKIQKHGLFALMADKLFHMKQLEGEKIKMGEVLQFIPELSSLFNRITGKVTFLPVQTNGDKFYLSESILNTFHMTKNRFIDFYQTKSIVPLTFHEVGDEEKRIVFQLEQFKGEPVPLKYNLEAEHYSFPLTKDGLLTFPELLLHYLLLYNLGMIARYEIDWWSELIKMMPNEDFPFIQYVLDITAKKGPYLIEQYLATK
ncbi:YaaC family protein [Bacillus sp. B15-48]|uniref:YaaC family protein n=1 Tax=Bacillus sp. B15-48 TaxID=1548601 RepID=UPI0031B8A842